MFARLSDEGTEDAVYDSQAILRFVGIGLNREAAPDATTLLKFCHLLEEHHLTESIFNAINAHLADRGLFLREGTIVDATLIAAPSSTKNKERKRDSEMHQTKKGNQWYFGMKAHIEVDAQSGLAHTLIGTAANTRINLNSSNAPVNKYANSRSIPVAFLQSFDRRQILHIQVEMVDCGNVVANVLCRG